MIGLIAMLLVTLASAAAAVGLYAYSRRRERTEDVLLRMRAGDEATAAAAVVSDREVQVPIVRWACHVLWRAGSDIKPGSVVIILLACVGAALLIPLLFGLFKGGLIVAASALLVAMVISQRIDHRRARIVEQLPNFLEAVMRVLAAGNTLEEAIGAASREAIEPSRALFLSVSRQVRLGAPVDVVLADAADIHQIRDLRVLALAANINRKYGGTLRNVFRSVIQAIRMREAAARELRALTAETRFSAVVLAGVPVLVSGFIYWRNHAYYLTVLATTSGQLMLLSAVVLQIIGVFIIWRMMKATQDGTA